MQFTVLPFKKKIEEEITGQQGNRNFYQVKFISYLGTSIFINKSLSRQLKLKVPSGVYLNEATYHTNYVNLESAIKVLRQVAQQGVTRYSSINYS